MIDKITEMIEMYLSMKGYEVDYEDEYELVVSNEEGDEVIRIKIETM